MCIEIIEKITKLNLKSQNQRLKFFEKLDTERKIEIFKNHKINFYKFTNNYKDVETHILSYCALLISLDDFYKSTNKETIKFYNFNHKNQDKDNKGKKLLQYWSILKGLREKGTSFEKISKYFLECHKFKISCSLIYKRWNEIEGKGK